MKVLDLFSGIGGMSLGLERAGMTTVAFCERDEWCRQLLAKRWPEVPIHDEIRTLDGTLYRGEVDLVAGGFPCQPFSRLGKRGGASDDRHLWPDMARIVREVRPAWVLGENVPGIVGMALDEVLSDLEDAGYDAWAVGIPAIALDAPHRRQRIWILAHLANANGPRLEGHAGHGEDGNQSGRIDAEKNGFASAGGIRRGKRYGATAESGLGGMDHGLSAGLDGPRRWADEPSIPRVAPKRDHHKQRLMGLGNSVVPQVVERIGQMIMRVEEAREGRQ